MSVHIRASDDEYVWRPTNLLPGPGYWAGIRISREPVARGVSPAITRVNRQQWAVQAAERAQRRWKRTQLLLGGGLVLAVAVVLFGVMR